MKLAGDHDEIELTCTHDGLRMGRGSSRQCLRKAREVLASLHSVD